MESTGEDEDGRKERRNNPRHGANPLSVVFFWWTIKLFKLGYRKPILEDNLHKPVPHDSSSYLGDRLQRDHVMVVPTVGASYVRPVSQLRVPIYTFGTSFRTWVSCRGHLLRNKLSIGRNWEDQVAKSKVNGKHPSLTVAVLKTFGVEYFSWGLLLSINELVLRMIQPFLLGNLLSYFIIDSTMERNEALLYAAGIIVCTAVNAIIINHYTMEAFHIGMRARVASCSLIYRKSLRLTCTALGDTSVGKIINMLSNDVARFDIAAIMLNYLWISPLSAIIAGFMVYQEIGVAGIVGVAAVFLIVPLQSWTGSLSSKFRMRSAVRTDERVRLMDEIIRGIRVIKMYAWEKPFAKLIANSRRREINVIRKASFIRGLYMTFNLFTTRLALFCAIATYVSIGHIASADKVFVVSSYFNILSHTMSGFFARGIAEIAEARVSLGRLQSFLMLDEFKKEETSHNEQSQDDSMNQSNGTVSKNVSHDNQKDSTIVMDKFCAKWNPNSSDITLSSVNLNVSPATLLGIIGPVGCGKSSLLQAILGEVTKTSGTIRANGRISYASQEPWVFGGTIRQNILFGAKYDEKRYRTVTAACALKHDFRQLPRGDLTHVGDRGTLLSGGQRARVNLARALYRKADIFLLDDPLSAVDAHVGRHLMEECLTSPLLRGGTVLLATHQIQHLREADEIILLEEGSIKAQGSYEDLMGVSDGGGKSNNLEAKDSGIAGLIRSISQMSATSKRSSISEDPTLKNEAEKETEGEKEAEKVKKGSVDGMVYMRYFTSGAQPLSVVGIIALFALTQSAASGVDYFVSVWTKNEELRLHQRNLQQNLSIGYSTLDELTASVKVPSESQHQANYIMEPLPMPTNMLLGFYGAAVATLFIISIVRSTLFFVTCMRCSTELHDSMFKALVKAPMNFFDSNPAGRILNRFSKDVGAIDEFLPKALLDSTQILMVMVGAVIVSTTVNYLFLVPVIILGIIFWILRSFYLHISRKVKRIEGITRSPIFTHIGNSLQGLPTIRAHKAEIILQKEFDNIQDINSAAYFMYISISTGFGICLDIMCVIYVSLVTFSFLFFDQEFVGGNVGLAITQSMLLTGMFQWGVRQTAEVENQMTAVERVIEYTDLEEEKNEPKIDPKALEGWPAKGQICFKNVGMSYKKHGRIVIRNLNFIIKPYEKVGIVGRTGAGKSSLIATLLRLGYIEEGAITIDGVNTCHIDLQILRSNISVIPQDPVLFSGTLRSNLDPFQEYGDHLLWKALEDVELKEIASEAHGLDTRILEGGSNISVGQRQLLCLARAILRQNQILLLDEATANVDPKTDALIQLTIRKKFAACTVITVAHRLNTIMDYDRVIVMSEGKLVEFDHPHLLLQNKDGYFYKMVRETGIHMARTLAGIAEQGYKKRYPRRKSSLPIQEETTDL